MAERRYQTRLAEHPQRPELAQVDHHGIPGIPVAQERHHAVIARGGVPFGTGLAIDDQGLAARALSGYLLDWPLDWPLGLLNLMLFIHGQHPDNRV